MPRSHSCPARFPAVDWAQGRCPAKRRACALRAIPPRGLSTPQRNRKYGGNCTLLRFGFLLAVSASLFAQPGIPNGDFENGAPGTLPAPWFVPAAFQHW